MLKISWNEHEEAILLQTLIDVLNHQRDRKQAIAEVSIRLRALAKSRGVVIDEKFRNENGIALQMSKLEYVFTEGKSGLYVSKGWYFDIVQLYRSAPDVFQDLLKDDSELQAPDRKDKSSFSEWLDKTYPDCSKSIQTTFNMLNVLLLKNKTIDSNLSRIKDISKIDDIVRQLQSNKNNKLHANKKNKSTFVNALNKYKEFLLVCISETDSPSVGTSSNKVLDDKKMLGVDSSSLKESPFYIWLIEQGMSQATARSYASAINTADAYVIEHKNGCDLICGTDDWKKVEETTTELFRDPVFLEINERQHNRMRTSLNKYKEYLKTAERHERTAADIEMPGKVDLIRYREILSAYFRNGYRINSKLDMGRFRSFWSERYGEELAESDDIVRKNIVDLTIQYQDFVYLPEEMLDSATSRKVMSYLDKCFENGINAVYFDALYKEFQKDFINTHINNPGMLRAYLSYENDSKYCIQKNYIASSEEVTVNPVDDVRNYLITAGIPVSVEDLKNALSHIDGNEVFWIIAGHNSQEFVRNQKGEYFHADIIQFTPNEIAVITEMIQETISDKDYMCGKELTDAIETRLPSVMERYSFLTWLGLRDVIAYKLRDRFSFKGKIISAYGKELSMSDIFARFASSHEQFTLEQLNQLKRDLDTAIYFDSVYANSLRISKEEFVSRNQACFDVRAIDAAISRFCVDDYIALKEISFFGSFPYPGFPWNAFLLEHYVADFSNDYRLMHIGFAAECATGVVVKRESRYESFDELICSELASSNIPLTVDAALQYLVDIGFLARKNYKGIEQTLEKAKMLRTTKG